MKFSNFHIFIFAHLLLLPAAASAQFSINGVEAVGVESSIDTVFVAQSLAGASLTYTPDNEAVRDYVWYSYDQSGNLQQLSSESVSGATSIALLDSNSQGYRLDAGEDGPFYVWIFNYGAYPVSFGEATIDDTDIYCTGITLNAEINAAPMEYNAYQAGGSTEALQVERSYELSFDSVYFSTDTYVYEPVKQTINGSGRYDLPAPLDNTAYKIKGDQFALQFGVSDSVETEEYVARAVELHAIASVRIRENATNELDRSDPQESSETVTSLEGSAPLNLEILNYSSPAGYFYEWCVSTDRSFDRCSISSITRDFRYTFEEQGTYYIRLQVSNNTASDDPNVCCTQEKTWQVDVLNSSLEIPNVFTPNGDGTNDEFRVAYRSLISFRGVIYNVWGRKVFEWTDPATGWDGTIGGRPAAEGVYYYVIEATGDDYDTDGKRKTYFYKGDINLLR